MSYLVDALRKAENERRQGVTPDVVALSSGLPRGHRGGSGLIGWIVAVLIVCNLLLFGYLFWPQLQQISIRNLPTVAGNAAKAVSPATSGTAGQPVARAATTITATPASVQKAQVSATAPAQASQVETKRYSGPVPEVTVQGHLFSNEPAESFILVNGHIYHEGERLPDGVAVVRIGRNGALLNYRGRRFHVDGPG